MIRFIFGHFNSSNPLFGVNNYTEIRNLTNLQPNEASLFVTTVYNELAYPEQSDNNIDYYLGTNIEVLEELGKMMEDNVNLRDKTSLVYDNGWKFFGCKWDNINDIKEMMKKDIEAGMI